MSNPVRRIRDLLAGKRRNAPPASTPLPAAAPSADTVPVSIGYRFAEPVPADTMMVIEAASPSAAREPLTPTEPSVATEPKLAP